MENPFKGYVSYIVDNSEYTRNDNNPSLISSPFRPHLMAAVLKDNRNVFIDWDKVPNEAFVTKEEYDGSHS